MEELRKIMRDRSTIQGPEINAYIVTTFDEHQSHQEDGKESRLQYISGFSGPIADAVVSTTRKAINISMIKWNVSGIAMCVINYFQVTFKSAALWTEQKYVELADQELDCEWKIFVIEDEPSLATWLSVKN